MTHPEVRTEICVTCRGKHYVLFNQDGRVQGKLCDCFQCEVCGGEGRVFEETESGLSFLRDCECRVLARRLRRLGNARIPGKFVPADFDTYQKIHASQGNAKRAAMDFVSDLITLKNGLPRGLVFMGDPGLGKTHLAVAILKALILQGGLDCKFVDFFQLLSDIRHGYSEDLSDKAFMDPYLKARVLVIDELAKGRNTEWELTVLDQLISSRYNSSDQVTLFTTNYHSEQRIDRKEFMTGVSQADLANSYKRESLQERVGTRIYSRLAEMCKFIMIQGQDFRQKKLSPTQRYPRVKR